MKLLIADDDQSSRDLLRGFLTKRGFEVFEAVNGQEAMDQIYDITPKALLLDYSMPKLTGSEVLLRLQDQPIEGLKVFMLTGHDSEEKIAEMEQAGADKVFCKPYDLLSLLEELNALKG